MHLLLGPFAAGQRDFLMSIPAVAAAWASARAAETRSYRPIFLLLAGAFAATAASIKPTALLLLLLPALASRLRWRDVVWILRGAAAIALLAAAVLAAWGAWGAFFIMMRELLPLYGAMGARPLPEILEALQWILPMAGLALAAALS